MSTGPGLNLPFDSSGLSLVEQYKAAIKAAGGELKKLDSQMAATAKRGEEIDAKTLATYNQIESMRNDSQGKLRQITERFSQAHEAHQLERTGKSIGRLFGGNVGQKLMRGEKLDAGDIVREALMSERLAQKAFKMAGFKDATIMELGAAIPIVAEAVNKGIEAYHKVQEDRKIAAGIGRQYSRGEIGDSEFNLFQGANGNGQGGYNPLKWNWGGMFSEAPDKVLERAQKSSDAFGRLTTGALQNVLDNYNKDIAGQSTAGGVWEMMTGGAGAGTEWMEKHIGALFGMNPKNASDIQNKINNAMRERKKWLGTSILEKEEQTRVIRDTIINEGLSTDLQNRLIKANEDAADESKRPQKTASKEFYDHEVEIQHRISFEIRHKRIPANPVDF